MQKKFLLLIILTCSFSSHIFASSWEYNVDVFMGYKKVKTSDWGPVDDQFLFGTSFYTKPKSSYFGFNASSMTSFSVKSESNIDYTGIISELDLGGHFDIKLSRLRFLANAGLALAIADYEVDTGLVSTTDSTAGAGFYTNAELQFMFTDFIHAGFKLGTSYINAEFDNKDVNIGGTSIGLTFGVKF